MDRPTPRTVEDVAGLRGINCDLPEVLLLVLNALVEPAHHPKVVELSPFAEVGPIRYTSLDAEEVVE